MKDLQKLRGILRQEAEAIVGLPLRQALETIEQMSIAPPDAFNTREWMGRVARVALDAVSREPVARTPSFNDRLAEYVKRLSARRYGRLRFIPAEG